MTDDARPGAETAAALLSPLLEQGRLRVTRSPFLDRAPAALPAPTLADRVRGMLFGLAIGDALGNTSESMNPGRRRAVHGTIRDYLENRHAADRAVGLPSDDTQMAMYTVEHLLDTGGTIDPELLADLFTTRPIFGMGSTVREFRTRRLQEEAAWDRAGVASAGNGALMRIAPVLLPHLRTPSSALWWDTLLATMLTHNDPGALSSSVAFVAMLWELLGRADPPEAGWWAERYVEVAAPLEGATRYASRVPGDRWAGPIASLVASRVPEAVAARRSVREAGRQWHSGAFLLETVPTVLHLLALHAGEPEEALVVAVNDTRDNDTVAAIAGAALGALHGESAFPARWRDRLLGRTGVGDDGRVHELVEAAVERFVPAV